MKKKLVCGFLCLGLCLGSAQAAETGFTDVKDDDWFAPYVSVCVESGLMKGTGDGTFNPSGTITVAEVAAIAARMRESATGEAIPGVTPRPGESLPWYQQYVGYLTANGVAVPEPTKNATRQDFISLLSAVTPAGELTAINSISSLPDTADPEVLAFYNAGILTGTDDFGTFAGDRTLTRSEAAAMVSRVVRKELRLPFVPAQPSTGTPSAPVSSNSGNLGGDVVMLVNGREVPRSELENWINAVAYHVDSLLYNYYNTRLDLSDREMVQAVLEQAQVEAAAHALLEEKAAGLGCQVSALPQVLFPSPSAQELGSYVKENGLLRAKHILVSDEQTAQAVLSGLEAVPTLEQFNALLSIFGTDPGMTSNPDGYLFGPGEMVAEFENGTRALEIGTYSTEPVQSTHGYHIIWRLDPLTHPDLTGQYQEAALNQALDSWLQQAQVQTDDQAIGQIDVAALYKAYLGS